MNIIFIISGLLAVAPGQTRWEYLVMSVDFVIQRRSAIPVLLAEIRQRQDSIDQSLKSTWVS